MAGKKKKGGHGRRKTTIPKAPLRKLLKQQGAERVSNTAIEEMQGRIAEMAKTAVILTRHRKRKTVQRKDIPKVDGI